ncbi:helix-turn-helix transcriptional regulator [Ramlibacter sp.]|uniref:helix-turn-helix domain-containing protein n=1 Tax=Ramlibacter sp. TaxID=1917967 RepID=UPI002B5C9886|nr:helix-turn-helix transcriptional regulator [Ramlibacter sp.]HWI81513.1 helix-turn-helix transcriptional regulator [Ramlibacter sp.]
MSTPIPTSILKHARDAAGISQTQLASRLKVTPSVVSRLESSDQADAQMAARYLAAVDTDLAKEVVQFYRQKWRHIERPSFLHPERHVLWLAEEALQSLERFEGSEQFDAILQEPLNRLRNRILTETEFIRHMEHGIGFIGDIGVGKTTALSFVTNLLTSDKESKQSVFPTGSGRTTVCEVAIKIAPTFGIAVDSLAEEEIRALTVDLVQGIKSGKGGLPSELERVIRNMSDLRRIIPRAKLPGERPKPSDALKDLIDKTEDMDQVVAEVISRMRLDARTQEQMILSESAENSMQWLASNIAKINYGQHPNFSVPQRITVLLPLNVLRDTPFRLSVIDTKGVEGTTQRPDLKAQFDDPRTVTVLCSKFSDAPGTTPLSIVREIIDSGSDAIDAERMCLLVLPREDEATKIIDDSGTNPTTAEEGYAVRENQVEQQFMNEGLPSIPVNFFNVGSDNPEEIWAWLISRIHRVRANKVVRIERLVSAAADLISNSDIAKTRQARRTIAETMEQAARRFSEPPGVIRPAHQNLVEQAKKGHQSSIAASVNRRGKWENFQVAHILGVGVRNDANLRTRETVIRLDEQLQGLKEKYAHLLDVKEFVQSVQDDLTEWRQEFLARSALIGRVSYSPYLDNATEMWNDCAHRYGAGSGYRVDVADIFQTHFEEDDEAQAAKEKVEAALANAWIDLVIERLRAAVAHTEEKAT